MCGSTKVEIVDLPGTYSLTADSAEERIARDFIIDGHADLVLVVVNALCLDRTLYYGAEIAAMGIPYVVALNMTDMAEDAGITVDSSRVAQGLGTPVFPLVASRGKGIEQLRAGLEQALSSLNRSQEGIGWLSGEMMALHRDLADEIIPLAKTRQRGAWDALKLMEGDPEARQDLAVKDRGVLEWADSRLAGFSHVIEQLAEAKYQWIRNAIAGGSIDHSKPNIRTWNWDRISTHPFWGVILLLGIFAALVMAGLAAGLVFGHYARAGFDEMEAVAGRLLASTQMPWVAWVVRGAIRGAGSVVTVTPMIAIFTMFFAFLEGIGYMARAAYVMDRFMIRIGLNGRAFIPLLFSMPCTIIGAMACRIGDSGRQRLLTLLLVPLVPCSAKLIISSVIASWFFPLPGAVGVVLGLFLVNCLILGLLCRVFDRILFPDRSPDPLIMEMPPYQRPAWGAILKHTWNRAVNFVKRVANVLVGFSALLSFACYYPTGEINTSLFGRLGHALEPVSHLMGLDWKMLTILMSSLLNKEAILATAAVIFNVGQQDLPALMQTTVSVSGAITFMYATNVFVPCFAAISVIHAEGGKRYRLLAGVIGYTVILSIGGGILFHQVIRLVAG